MSQSRKASLAEAFTNVAIGFGIALCAQVILARFYGLNSSLGTDFAITCWFTVISLVRSYLLRRLYNWLGEREC